MKWMMSSVAMLVAVVLPAAVGAQSGTMAKGDKMDKMEMKDATYTGCIAAGTAAGTFTLTHTRSTASLRTIASGSANQCATANDSAAARALVSLRVATAASFRAGRLWIAGT